MKQDVARWQKMKKNKNLYEKEEKKREKKKRPLILSSNIKREFSFLCA